MTEAIESIKRIQNDVSSFTKIVQRYAEQNNRNIPQAVIYTSNTFRNRKYEYFVGQPSKLVRDAPIKNRYFQPTAEWLMDNNFGFDFPLGYDSNNSSQIRIYYQKKLFEFAKIVLDYCGNLSFCATDFRAAYDDLFTNRYSSIHRHRIIVPLPKLVLRDKPRDQSEVVLSPSQNPVELGRYHISHLSKPTISKLTDEEMTGLQTYGTPGMTTKRDQTQKRLGWAYKLEFDLSVKERKSFHNEQYPGIDPSWTAHAAEHIAAQIAKRILTTVRLFEPEKYVGIGPIYTLEPSWLSYRGICADVSRSHYTNLTQQGNTISRNRLDLFPRKFDELQRYIHTNIGSFNLEEKSELTPALNRFNQMYKKSNRQDKIIDCFIGFETTLLRDGGASTKIPDRGTALLKNHPDIDPRYAHGLLSLLISMRNGVVHRSAQISDYLKKGKTEPTNIHPIEKVNPQSFVKQARSILAHVIREYAYLMQKKEMSIHEINIEILDNRIRTS